MTLFGWILLIILAIIILILSISLILVIKRASYFSKRGRELIIFVIDMYIQYGEEIGITSEDKHDALIKELNKIRKKLE
jgi:hypothetical protein